MIRFLWTLSLVALPIAGWCEPAPSGTPIKVPNGVSTPDFTADGRADLIVSAHRENFNAHSFEVVTFYVLVAADESGKPLWNLISLKAGEKESLEVVVSGGADCVIHDFRLLAGPKPDSATLVLADRDFGDNYAAVERVTFTYLMLRRNYEGLPGEAIYTFVKTQTVRSQRSYCDVGDALKGELNLGSR